MRIYLTHCSAKKDASLRASGNSVTSDILYTAIPTTRFMQRYIDENVRWAIFSDLYGVWFPDVTHHWYEKDPETVSNEEYCVLLADFDRQLAAYTDIVFYHNPSRFHPLYARILRDTALAARVSRISHLEDITRRF